MRKPISGMVESVETMFIDEFVRDIENKGYDMALIDAYDNYVKELPFFTKEELIELFEKINSSSVIMVG